MTGKSDDINFSLYWGLGGGTLVLLIAAIVVVERGLLGSKEEELETG